MSIEAAKILVVDDEPHICQILWRWLTSDGYECVTAHSGEVARKLLESGNFQLVVSDIMMPGMSGIDLLSIIKTRFPDVAVIMATAVDDRNTATLSLELGAYGYVMKPFDKNDVLISVANALERRRLALLSQEYEHTLEKEIVERTREVREREKELALSLEKLERAFGQITDALSNVVEKRDPYTAGHQRHVANLACAIAGEMDASAEEIQGIRVAGILHDIGKMNVPGEMLVKPGRVTEVEFAVIKTHAEAGYDILKDIEFPWPVAAIAREHHERMDGSGYPLGLKERDILLESRIIAVADVVEAMSAHRPYRPALGMDKAVEEIRKNRGILYDNRVVDACIRVLERGFKFE